MLSCRWYRHGAPVGHRSPAWRFVSPEKRGMDACLITSLRNQLDGNANHMPRGDDDDDDFVGEFFSHSDPLPSPALTTPPPSSPWQRSRQKNSEAVIDRLIGLCTHAETVPYHLRKGPSLYLHPTYKRPAIKQPQVQSTKVRTQCDQKYVGRWRSWWEEHSSTH